MRDFIPAWRRAPRTTTWLVLAVLLLAAIAIVAPQQLPVVIYKASLVALAAVLGYWLDRTLFPYARPDSYLQRDWRLGTDEPEHEADFPVVPNYWREFCTAQVRRALIVGCAVLGMAAGL
ncbi:MAG: hypothetical protein F9K35_01495 [Burkholderiaceae bacterium]|nr:MAG: hypothetical protein F9K35_01495 [Burkholderiaceae bacterium]